jgi:SAM-dependent methyltransferase
VAESDSSIFDRHGEQYATLVTRVATLSGEDATYFARHKVDRIRALYDGAGPPKRVVDVGCGVGLLTELLARAWPSTVVTGVDVSTKSLDAAVSRCAGLGNVVLSAYAGNRLPREAEQADLVILANVLHHVERGARPGFMRMLAERAVRSRGRLVVFEHNPYNPLTRVAVRLCEFDRDAQLLSRRAVIALMRGAALRPTRSEYIVFFPRLLHRCRALERYMGRWPLGAQYMLVGEPM